MQLLAWIISTSESVVFGVSWAASVGHIDHSANASWVALVLHASLCRYRGTSSLGSSFSHLSSCAAGSVVGRARSLRMLQQKKRVSETHAFNCSCTDNIKQTIVTIQRLSMEASKKKTTNRSPRSSNKQKRNVVPGHRICVSVSRIWGSNP